MLIDYRESEGDNMVGVDSVSKIGLMFINPILQCLFVCFLCLLIGLMFIGLMLCLWQF